MPSTKSIAVVATLAASVTASNCKPTPKPTTTTSATTTTSSCPAYTLISEPAEDINCNVRGDPQEGQSQVLESLYLDDCAQKCKEFDLFNCELISFVEPASAEEQGS
ncbi:transmembrane transporter Liz1p, partial [Fusarium circinatum]